MSLPEIIPSSLPQFVQNKNRSSFENSVIPSGSVLLFAESDGNGGSKLIAKNPDGSFSEVGGGSSMSFYKCASVGTGTWSGYLASIDSTTGVWSFADTATSGLTYDRITPVVGNVYDEGCTFMVSEYKIVIPTNGLVLHIPLNQSSDKASTGQNLTEFGTITYDTVNNIPCAYFNSNSRIEFSTTGLPTSSEPWTVCGWGKGYFTIFQYGTGSSWNYFAIEPTGEGINVSNYGNDIRVTVDKSSWKWYCVTFDGAEVKVYIDNSEVSSGDWSSLNIDGSGTYHQLGGIYGSCYVAGVRQYNRVITAEERAALASEFTPTAS